MNAEQQRLEQERQRQSYWRKWGPYLSERQWGTVREDYSATGEAWDYFPHDHARSRAYRWGEDGILGISDNHQRLCFSLSLWNEKDPILKERMFGLTGTEGNHGEDVKEYYFYLDATPTHSYLKGLYKYPQAAFPYENLIEENRRRGQARAGVRVARHGHLQREPLFRRVRRIRQGWPRRRADQNQRVNHGPDPAPLHLLPTLWYRNTWAFGDKKPASRTCETRTARGRYPHPANTTRSAKPSWRGTACRSGVSSPTTTPISSASSARRTTTPFQKDGIGRFLINGETGAVNPAQTGTKAPCITTACSSPGKRGRSNCG